MDWLSFGIAGFSMVLVPLVWGLAFLRRRRSRALVRHDTTPPTPGVTTAQRR